MTGRLENRGVLITGGTGTFARAFIPHCLREGAARIVALGRHEVEMARLERDFGAGDKDQMRYYLGDVRDLERLKMAMHGATPISVVIHAAALKRIEQCERDPLECVSTNVMGSVNVITACLETNVERCLLLSTDKAVHPINMYGASKLCAERVFMAANGLSAGRCKFGVVRYGNIWKSRGSIHDVWYAAMMANKPIIVTDREATRFFMTTKHAVALVLETLDKMIDGPLDIQLPHNLPAYQIGDLIEALMYNYVEEIGLPPWEKKHETLNGHTYSNEAPRLTIEDLRLAWGFDV
jgi:UDP-N-acetylglucosamine 4,6-dehydratase